MNKKLIAPLIVIVAIFILVFSGIALVKNNNSYHYCTKEMNIPKGYFYLSNNFYLFNINIWEE